MTIVSAKNTPRNSYTATSSQTAFTIGFEFFAVTDVKVFKNGTLMTYNASPSTNVTYKITGTASSSDEAYEFGAGGTVTFGAGLAADDIVVIVRDIAVERTTDFTPSGAFDITTLNTQLDTIISMVADTQQQTDRSVKLLDTDTVSATVTLPAKTTRASKVASFDSDGNLETTITSTGLSALNDVTSEIGLLGTSANVTAMGLLGTSAVVADMALLGTSAVVADMAILATSDVVADMAILATSDIVSDLNTLATSDIVSDINILATSDIVSDLNTLATSAIVTDLSILATSDIVSDINVLATSDIVSDLNTLATSDFVSDLNTLASSTVVANIATVASNVAGVNSFAARYRVGSSDPASDNDAGDLAYNTTSNTLKFFNGSSYSAISTTFSIDGASDTTLTSPADGALLLYDTGTSKFIDNVVSGDATLADTGALTIADDAVTYAKIQNVSASDKILGRDSSGAGVIEEITPANLRTMINVADGANAYTHPNHSGEVTSTADGATVIADNIVDEANLKISNAPVNGYMLTAQSGDTGGLTWAEAAGASSYIGKNVQVFTSTGTFTVPTGVTALKVTVIGGGGAGEKVTAASKKARGGGAGGCAIEWLTSQTSGASIAVTIGAGGTAGGDATAGDGGTSSFASLCSATGGQGGDTNSNSPGSGDQEIGHTGGAGSGGTFNFAGGHGGVNVRISGGYFGGNGGYPYPMSNHIAGAAQFQGPFTDLLGDTGSTSHFVGAYSDSAATKLLAYKQDFAMPQVLGGRAGKGGKDAAGAAGAGYGTGGGGAGAESSGTKNGGAGAAGVCIVEW